MKVTVIIPAAGLGTRMASAVPCKKQGSVAFKAIHRTERNARSLSERCARSRRTPKSMNSSLCSGRMRSRDFNRGLRKKEKSILAKKVSLVEGGEHRQDSVANGLNSVRAAADDIVLVHDAVRPFVTADIIDEVIAAAEKSGAAIAGLPAVDTIKQVERNAEGAVITATIPRERVVMAQTPQGFRYSVIKKAFDDATADGFVGTDEASLVERAGYPVMVVMGSARNIKITTPADMELAEFYLGK